MFVKYYNNIIYVEIIIITNNHIYKSQRIQIVLAVFEFLDDL